MPAIHPARLKIQVAQLAAQAHEPTTFIRALHNLLDIYADRTYRPGQAAEPPPLLDTYKTPAPVFRQIIQVLNSIAIMTPPSALALCDALWAEPYLEFRLLAVSMLGQIPPVSPESILGRLQTWIESRPEDRLMEALLTWGFSSLRKQVPDVLLELIESWLLAADISTRQVGLKAMLSLLSDPSFDNLPALFRLLGPLLRVVPSPLRLDLLDVLRSMAHRSPQEMAYVLRQNLTATDSSDTPWLLRQVLPEFPPDVQDNLRDWVKTSAPA
jgi:hypothetical protein